jgi:hypothetical protein
MRTAVPPDSGDSTPLRAVFHAKPRALSLAKPLAGGPPEASLCPRLRSARGFVADCGAAIPRRKSARHQVDAAMAIG